jgi:hypothetical protein
MDQVAQQEMALIKYKNDFFIDANQFVNPNQRFVEVVSEWDEVIRLLIGKREQFLLVLLQTHESILLQPKDVLEAKFAFEFA